MYDNRFFIKKKQNKNRKGKRANKTTQTAAIHTHTHTTQHNTHYLIVDRPMFSEKLISLVKKQ